MIASSKAMDEYAKGPVLITGGDGMLGRAWQQLLRRRGIAYESTDRSTLDISDAAAVERRLSPEINMVVNCAAWTDVDAAEEHEADATKINGDAVDVLAERCRAIDALLVHFSTDYVFDGRASQPYPTNHPCDPINAYGRSKLAGEKAIREVGHRHLIVRTSWLYAPWARNFVRTIARFARERDSLRVVDDQVGRPTSCEHLANGTLQLAECGATGTYNVTDGGQCSWFEFATEIAKVVNPACEVQPCSSQEFPRPARRPTYSVLDLTATEALIGPMPCWKENLADVLARLEPVAV